MDITTFGGFTTARLGIYAAQKALNVTGHNIANINTRGYSRQAADQISLRVGGSNRYASAFGGSTGSGVLITGMSQFRDPYLDIRYRSEASSTGELDTKMSGLEALNSILDEVAKNDGNGVIEEKFNDLVKQISNVVGEHATEEEFKSLVQSSGKELAKLLNSYSSRLETVKEDQEAGFKQDVDSVNDILKSIQKLNDTILKSEVYGDSALELRDQRNLLIDELSKNMKIDVTYEPVKIGAGATVDKLVIKTAGKPSKTLVDGEFATQLSIHDRPVGNPLADPANPNYDPTALPFLKPDGTATDNLANDAELIHFALDMSELRDANGEIKAGSTPLQIGDTELTGGLQARREMLTEAGEFSTTAIADNVDPDATIKRGIPYYQKTMDALARKFATVMNEANTGHLRNNAGNYVGADGKELIEGGAPIPFNTKLNAAQEATLNQFGIKLGGPLFSTGTTNDTTTGITAGNISISKSWSGNVALLQHSFVQLADKPGQVGSTDGSNMLHMAALLDGKQVYLPDEMDPNAANKGQKFFEGSFQGLLINTQGLLGQDTKGTATLLNNSAATATNLDVSRMSVSGVDLNDEALNLMTFQKAYTAACRLMTTMDETLDKLINGTGVVGR